MVEPDGREADFDWPQPWVADAIQRLDLRRNDRVLLLPAQSLTAVAAVRRAVGATGRIVLIEPDPARAEWIAALCASDAEVVCGVPEARHVIGTFDAILVCPLRMLPIAALELTGFLAGNLRPGGRFVVDLPAESPLDLLVECWLAGGGDPAALASLAGPGEDALAAAFRNQGMRNVESAIGVHLVVLDDVRHLLDLVPAANTNDPSVRESASRCLVQRVRTMTEVEILMHRTRFGGLR